jgi:hypothetical protein
MKFKQNSQSTILPIIAEAPDRPHEHYFIQWKGLESGDRTKIIKSSKKRNKYNLKFI